MGSFGSSRYKNYQRKLCVEDCQRQKASNCPVCGRGVRFIYAPPSTLAAQGFARYDWACRSCHGLTYLSRQTWGTLAGDMANDADLLGKYASAAENTLDLYKTMPVGLQSANEMMRWMDSRQKQLKAASAVISMCNRIPETRVQALLRGEIKTRPPRRRKKKKSSD